MASVGSPAALSAAAALRATFSGIQTRGILNQCRGGSSYVGCSQHSWGNAIDISGPSSMPNGGRAERAFLEQVFQWLKLRFTVWQVQSVIWDGKNHISGTRDNDHDDHIHISFWPRGFGNPACGSASGRCNSGGTLATWKWRDGHTEARNNRSPPAPEGNFGAWEGTVVLPPSVGASVDQNTLPLYFGYTSTLVRQYQLRLIAWMPQALPAHGADSNFGEETLFWVQEFQRQAGLTVDGVIGTNTAAALNVGASPPVIGQDPGQQPPGEGLPPGPIEVTTATLGQYAKFYHPVLGRPDPISLRTNQLSIQDYLMKMSDQVAKSIVDVSVIQKGAPGTVTGHGDEMYLGHGPPVALNTPGAAPGDEYVDLDTGEIYTLT